MMNRALLLAAAVALPSSVIAQGTRLLRQPTVSATHLAFEYGGDLWITEKGGGEARRLTSTPAVEADPQFSPDGRSLAFTSNRGGNRDVYLMPVEGGDPRRLTWHPGNDDARGWSPDGKQVLFASNRNTAPTSFARLWTVPAEGGIERLIPAPMAIRGSWSPDGKRLAYDRVTRWDIEFRNYRGGQNTPLTILDVGSLEETRLPNERSSDTQPIWVGQTIYFLSDRDYAVNIWAYDVGKPTLRQVTHFKNADVKYLAAGGELSVGHSFVGGGDLPAVDSTRTGLLGADLSPEGDRWKIARIYTGESWNPELRAPLDAPGLRIRTGNYILEVNGADLRATDNPWRLLDGTAEQQTVLRLNDRPVSDGSWLVTVVPLRTENAFRTRAWVEDNRRKVDSLSGGRLGYVWVPNTGGPGYASFNRYFFAQQDKAGAVIDERFNGGGLLDDYMVDYMGRQPIGGVSNDAPGGVHFPLPMAGILGPKVLLVNEFAGSGGDYFPWAFRQLKVGPIIGTRTWGGLVAASVPSALMDGGTITAPSSAVFTLNGEWPAEGEGIPPDIDVPLDAKSVAAGRDPQLERGIAEALELLHQSPVTPLTLPRASKRARWPAP